jgi:hypothetical protein
MILSSQSSCKGKSASKNLSVTHDFHKHRKEHAVIHEEAIEVDARKRLANSAKEGRNRDQCLCRQANMVP